MSLAISVIWSHNLFFTLRWTSLMAGSWLHLRIQHASPHLSMNSMVRRTTCCDYVCVFSRTIMPQFSVGHDLSQAWSDSCQRHPRWSSTCSRCLMISMLLSTLLFLPMCTRFLLFAATQMWHHDQYGMWVSLWLRNSSTKGSAVYSTSYNVFDIILSLDVSLGLGILIFLIVLVPFNDNKYTAIIVPTLEMRSYKTTITLFVNRYIAGLSKGWSWNHRLSPYIQQV